MSPLRAKVFLSHGDWSLILVSRSPEAERFLVALWAGQEGRETRVRPEAEGWQLPRGRIYSE